MDFFLCNRVSVDSVNLKKTLIGIQKTLKNGCWICLDMCEFQVFHIFYNNRVDVSGSHVRFR